MNIYLRRIVFFLLAAGGTTLLHALTPPTTGAIAGGYGFTLALKSNGTVWTWGKNNNGQLGNGTTTNQSGPEQISGLSGMVAIAAGSGHSLALKSDGTVWAWGYNGNGELGNGNTISQLTPVPVSGLSGVNIVAVAAGAYHSLALDSQGQVWAWGYNGYGQLGDGTTTERNTPVQVSGLSGVNIVAIAAGFVHSLALDNQGRVWAWGNNNGGQLGTGNTMSQSTPILVSGLSGVTLTTVAAGGYYGLAVDSKGRVWAWGENNAGQLGDGTTAVREAPVQVTNLSGVTVTAVAAGNAHSLAIDNQDRVWAWGNNAYGQLDDGTTTNQSTPMLVNNLNGALAVAAGAYHSLVLKNDGTVWAWGDNTYGQFGDGTAGTFRTSAVWANNLANITAVAAGDDGNSGMNGHNLALKNDGTVWAWGSNGDGQLGDGTTTDHVAPTQVNGLSGLTTGVAAVSAGSVHSLALDNHGNVWAWGYNGDYELGDGTTTNQPMPEKVNGLSNIIAIAAGDDHSLALQSDGTVWIFGTHYYQDGTSTTWTTPTQMSGLSGIKAIAAGYSFSLALDSQGNVWAWGYNADGELGNGTTTDNQIPTQVSGLSGVIALSAKAINSLALKNDGTIWQWGSQDDYISSWSFSSTSAEQVQSGFTGATALAAGYDSSIVLKSDGTVWAWGANDAGQLGDGTTTDQSTAVQASNLNGVTMVSAGWGNYEYKLALKGDGTLRGWGDGASAGFDLLLPVPAEAAIRLIPWADDPNQNGMLDTWPYYNQVSTNGLADTNGDGLTDIEEYLKGTNPLQPNSDALVDYYDGVLPVLTSLVDPSGLPGPEGLVSVKVTRASDGTPLANAPVSLAVTTGASEISVSEGGPKSTQVNVQTNSSGIASAYVGFLKFAPDVLVATAESGGQTQTLSINIQIPNVVGSPLSLPDMPNVVKPDPDPGLQSGWDVFTPPVSSTPAAPDAPTIAEWTCTGAPDDSLILTGDAFSNLAGPGQGDDTQFLVYGQTSSGDGVQSPALIQRLDGFKAAITLPAATPAPGGLPASGTYFVWPKNSAGYGYPVAVNRTEAWWLGPDQASPGDTVSVYGRNLTHNGGTTQSWVYIQQTGSTGQWATLVSPSSTDSDPVNPYQVQFTVPSSLLPGTYNIWVHNGHGGAYGWSGPLTLTVVAPYLWDSNGTFDKNAQSTFNVKNYGAKGDGATDDTAAINAAFSAASIYAYVNGYGAGARPTTLYFPCGTYMLSHGIGMNNAMRFLGDGMTKTILKCTAAVTSSNSTGVLGIGGASSHDIEVRDMTLDTNQVSFSASSFAFNGASNQCDHCNFTNVCIKELYVPGSQIQGCAGFTGTTHLTITGCTFIGGQVFFDSANQVAISNCTFDNDNGSDRSLNARGESEISITYCTSRDDYNPSNPGQGRFIAASSDFGTQSNYYIADIATNLEPPTTNNSGEQILCEGGNTQFAGNPAAATATTVAFNGLVLDPNGITYGINQPAWTAVVVSGRGLGQYRLVTDYSTGSDGKTWNTTGLPSVAVSPAWNVTPDPNSTVFIARSANRWAVYHNDLEGSQSLYEQAYSATTAMEPFGGCYDWIGDSNTIKYMAYGLSIAEIQQNPQIVNSPQGQIVSINPCYFHYYINNTIESCYQGIRADSDNPTVASAQNLGIGFLGTVFRNNTVSATIGADEATDANAAVYSTQTGVAPGVTLDMTLFEHNTFNIQPNLFPMNAPEAATVPEGFDCDLDTHYFTPAITNPVIWAKNVILYKNTFDGSAVASTPGTMGIYFSTTTLSPTLNDNTWKDFATTYAGSVPEAVLQLPNQTIDLPAASGGGAQTAQLTIEDVGTSPLTWTASSDSSWLTLSAAGGTAQAEDSPSTLTVTCDPTGLQPGTYTGKITVSGGAQPETVTVNFTVPPAVPTLLQFHGSNGEQRPEPGKSER